MAQIVPSHMIRGKRREIAPVHGLVVQEMKIHDCDLRIGALPTNWPLTAHLCGILFDYMICRHESKHSLFYNRTGRNIGKLSAIK